MTKLKEQPFCHSPEIRRINLSSEMGRVNSCYDLERVYQSPEMEIHIVESEGLIASSMNAPTEKNAGDFWSGGN